jgi:hypothetical protein
MAAIFALFFIITMPFGFLAFFSSNIIFNSEELVNTLNESLIASGALRSSITESLSEMEFGDEQEGDAEVRRAISELTVNEWNQIVDMLLPDEWMTNQIEEAVFSINTWLDDDRLSPDLVIDMHPIKMKMQGRSLFEIIDLIVDSWPTCTQEQVDEIQQSMDEFGHAPILYCEPPEPFRTELIEFAARRFQEFTQDMPDKFSLFELDEGNQDLDQVLLFKERVRTIRAFTIGGWLLSAALLGLIMVLAIRSWRDVAIWWGIPILVAGILTVTLGLSTGSFISRLVQGSAVDIQGSRVLYDLFMLPVSAIRERIAGEVLGVGLFLSLAGIGILIVSFLFQRAVRPAVQQQAGNVGYQEIPPPPPYPAPGQDEPTSTDADDGERPSGLFG